MSDYNEVISVKRKYILKKNIFRSTLLIVLFSLLIFIGGCAVIPKSVRKDLIVDYLNEKYTDDHFEFKSYSGGMPWSNEAVTIFCTSRKYPDKVIEAAYITDMHKYEDNYYGIKYAEQLDEYVYNYACELFPGHRIKCASYLDEIENRKLIDLPPDSSFEDYLKDCKEDIVICCEYEPEELENEKNIIEKKVKNSLEGLDMNVNTITINFTDNVDRDKKTIIRNIYKHLYLSFNRDGFNAIKKINWG